MECIFVFLAEASTRVRDVAGIMLHSKTRLVPLGSGKVLVLRVALAQLERKIVVCALLDGALLIEKVQQAHVFLLVYEVQALLIVNELDVLPLDALRFILSLLGLEDIPIELLLQPLIGVVDGQLLERIDLEIFETENVEDPNKSGDHCIISEHSVAACDQPSKLLAIDGFCQSFARIIGLFKRERNRDLVVTRHEASRAQCVAQIFRLFRSQKAAHLVQQIA
mmetsp:Transcript_87204/g.262030  ORF Transcript_87204/g.262030 Transcript_87204/m.262030 type:complete len:223 (-) Transcript_87204:298-966(-)